VLGLGVRKVGRKRALLLPSGHKGRGGGKESWQAGRLGGRKMLCSFPRKGEKPTALTVLRSPSEKRPKVHLRLGQGKKERKGCRQSEALLNPRKGRGSLGYALDPS